MLLRPTTPRTAPRILHRLYQCFAVIVSFLMICPPSLLLAATASSGPSWWAEQQVVASGNASDDYAALNQGQLKNLATKAAMAMEARLSGGAGPDIRNLINAWSQAAPSGSTRDDYAAVTLGQLKAVALPFYQRLQSVGLITAADYPWATSTNSPDNAAVANLGQAKHLFSFVLPENNQPDPTKAQIPFRVNFSKTGFDKWIITEGTSRPHLETASDNGSPPVREMITGTEVLTLSGENGRAALPVAALPSDSLRISFAISWNGELGNTGNSPSDLDGKIIFQFNGMKLAIGEKPYQDGVQLYAWNGQNERWVKAGYYYLYGSTEAWSRIEIICNTAQNTYSVGYPGSMDIENIPFVPEASPRLEFRTLAGGQLQVTDISVDIISSTINRANLPFYENFEEFWPFEQITGFHGWSAEYCPLHDAYAYIRPYGRGEGRSIEVFHRVPEYAPTTTCIPSTVRKHFVPAVGTEPRLSLEFWVDARYDLGDRGYGELPDLSPAAFFKFNGIELGWGTQDGLSIKSADEWKSVTNLAEDFQFWSNEHDWRDPLWHHFRIEINNNTHRYNLFLNDALIAWNIRFTPEPDVIMELQTPFDAWLGFDDISLVAKDSTEPEEPPTEPVIDPDPEGPITNPSGSYPPEENPRQPHGFAPGIGDTPNIPQYPKSTDGDYEVSGVTLRVFNPDTPGLRGQWGRNYKEISGRASVSGVEGNEPCDISPPISEGSVFSLARPYYDVLKSNKIYPFSANLKGSDFDIEPHTRDFTVGYQDFKLEVFSNGIGGKREEHYLNSNLEASGRLIGKDSTNTRLTDAEKNGFLTMYIAVDFDGQVPDTLLAAGPFAEGNFVVSDGEGHEWKLSMSDAKFSVASVGESGIRAFALKKFGGDRGLVPGKNYSVKANLDMLVGSNNAGGSGASINWTGYMQCGIIVSGQWLTGEKDDHGSIPSPTQHWILTPSPDAVPPAHMPPSMDVPYMYCGIRGDGAIYYVDPPEPKPAPVALTGQADDASGSRYRKIALNGQPMPDEKPQATPETDQHPEETFVDALTLQLRHQTTDAYLAVPGSDLAIQVRRNAVPEIWNHRYGQRPWERRDQPFGVSWSSNLAPSIRFVNSYGTMENPPDVPTAIVTDEQGASYRFLAQNDVLKGETFFPLPTAKHEQSSYLCSLKKVGGKYVFEKKFGTKLTYAKISVQDKIPSDRMIVPSNHDDLYTYARLESVSDRLGNAIDYSFSAPDSLIPSCIKVRGREHLKIDIRSDNGLVTAIWDANGYQTSYSYRMLSDGVRVLEHLRHADETFTRYNYSVAEEMDGRPKLGSPDPHFLHFHCDLSSITDPNGHTYQIDYAFDKSRYDFSPTYGHYLKTGIPRNVEITHLPDGNQAKFKNLSRIKFFSSGSAEKVYLEGGPDNIRKNTVTNTLGYTRTYTWDLPNLAVVKVPPKQFGAGPVPPNPVIVYYTRMNVAMPGFGQETFLFDPDAGLALTSATDLSGNTTAYTYESPVPKEIADEYNSNFEGKKPLNTPDGDPADAFYLNRFFDDPTSQTNALNYTKKFEYNTQRIMKTVIDELERKTVYDIDSLGRRTKERIFPDLASTEAIQETSFEYGDSRFPGFITQKTVRKLDSAPTGEGNLIVHYSPDDYGRVAMEVIDPGYGIPEQITGYTYNLSGDKLSVTDPKGYITAFHYDQRHRLTGVSYPNDTGKIFEYDARGNKIKETDERNKITRFGYDALNRLVSTTREMDGGNNIVTSQVYSPINTITSTTDANGNTATLGYDDLGRLTSTTTPETPVDADSSGTATQKTLTTTFAYGTNAGGSVFATTPTKPTRTEDPRGYVTEVLYDRLYRPYVTAVRYGDDQWATSYTSYDEVGNPTKAIDPLNNVTTTKYDALNRPFQIDNPDDTHVEVHYTSTGLRWKTVDELGRVTRQEYDGAGRPIRTILPAPTTQDPTPIITTEYDPNGNVAATIDPLGRRTEFIYDARNRKTRDILPEIHDVATNTLVSPRIKTEYDAAGNVICVTDARGNVTETVYDNANRPTKATAPTVSIWTTTAPTTQDLRPTTQTSYDPNGNILTITNADGKETSNAYDALNRLSSTTDPEHITVAYTYDAAGNKTSVKDGNGYVTRFTYDGLNRNLATIDPAGKAVTFGYNALNKINRTDSQGRITTYAYDVRHRLTDTVYGPGHSDNLHYTYDDVGNLRAVTTPNDTAGLRNVGYTYDNLNRVTTESSGNGSSLVTHAYAYDLIGNRTHTTYCGTQRSLASTYDVHNRLLTLTEGDRATIYGYDRAGNQVRLELPNGDTTEYTYDALSRAIEIHTGHDGRLLQNYAQNYDALGNVTRITETYANASQNRTVANTYDDNSRLIREQVSGGNDTAYTYDDGNNRTKKTVNGTVATFEYNHLNQLTSFTDNTGTTTYSYDLDGNRVQRTRHATDITTYSYDRENRLISLDATRSTLNAPLTYAYQYDYRTRRALRTEGNVSTRVVFSGGTSYSEHPFDALALSPSAPAVENIRGSDYGGGIGGILYTLRPNPQDLGPARVASFTHYNSRGDVTAKTDDTGSLTYQAAYEAFGTRTSETGSTQDRQKANTKDEDPTGLLNEGFRYRDLETGTFITRDPLGFVDGPNMYAYVVQNPWSKFDPEGLKYEYQYKEDKKDDTEEVKNANKTYNAKLDKVKNAHNKIRNTEGYYKKGSAVYDIDNDQDNIVHVRIGDESLHSREDINENLKSEIIYINTENSAKYIIKETKDESKKQMVFKYTEATIEEQFVHESRHAIDSINITKRSLSAENEADLRKERRSLGHWVQINTTFKKNLPKRDYDTIIRYPNKDEFNAVQEQNNYSKAANRPISLRYGSPQEIGNYWKGRGTPALWNNYVDLAKKDGIF